MRAHEGAFSLRMSPSVCRPFKEVGSVFSFNPSCNKNTLSILIQFNYFNVLCYRRASLGTAELRMILKPVELRRQKYNCLCRLFSFINI